MEIYYYDISLVCSNEMHGFKMYHCMGLKCIIAREMMISGLFSEGLDPLLYRYYYTVEPRLSEHSIIRHLDYPAQQINDIHYIFGVH